MAAIFHADLSLPISRSTKVCYEATNFAHFSQKLHLRIGCMSFSKAFHSLGLALKERHFIKAFFLPFQLYAWVDRRGCPSASMSGLQHPLEANGGAAGRATHIRFTPSVAGGVSAGAGTATGNGTTAGAPSAAAASVTYPASSGGSYIRAGAPNIPPQPMSSQVPGVSHQPAEFNRNPLLCLLCNQAFQNPCLLACYHTFCAACLKGRVVEGKLACPLCG